MRNTDKSDKENSRVISNRDNMWRKNSEVELLKMSAIQKSQKQTYSIIWAMSIRGECTMWTFDVEGNTIVYRLL